MPGGMSFTATDSIGWWGEEQDGEPSIELAGDAAHFSDDEMIEAAGVLSQAGIPVKAARRFAFSAIGSAVVLVILPLGTSVFGSYLYSALSKLIRPKRGQTVFQFRIAEGDRTVQAVLETDNEDVLRDALSRFADVEASSTIVEWSEAEQRWRRIR